MKRTLWNVNKAQCKESMKTTAGQEHRKWHSHAVPLVCFPKNICEIERCKYRIWPVEGEIISFIKKIFSSMTKTLFFNNKNQLLFLQLAYCVCV